MTGVRLSPEEAHEIVRLYAADDVMQRVIGEQYGVDASRINSVIKDFIAERRPDLKHARYGGLTVHMDERKRVACELLGIEREFRPRRSYLPRLPFQHRARLAHLWAVKKHTLGDLARELGTTSGDIRYAIECFVIFDCDKREVKGGLPGLRQEVLAILETLDPAVFEPDLGDLWVA